MTGKVLFVDDDQALINSIKRRMLNAEFKVFYATSGEEALKIMRSDFVDIVVSDIKMPSMDGIELLKKIQGINPSTNRLVVSGHVTYSEIVKLISQGIASSYMTKPWDFEKLYNTILSILNYREILKDRKLIGLFNSIDRLPPSPTTYFKFVDAMNNDESAHDIAKILSQDTSVATMLLHVANSAYYGSVNVDSVEKAVVTLGLALIKDIVLVSELASTTSEQKKQEIKRIVTTSAATNYLIEKLYTIQHKTNIPEQYKPIGITHDIGMMMLLELFPDRYYSLKNAKAKNPEKNFFEIEIEQGYKGQTHTEIGAYLLHLWNLPDLLISASLYHHENYNNDESLSEIIHILQLSVHIVECIEYNQPIDYNQILNAGITQDQINTLIKEVGEIYSFVKSSAKV